MQDSRELQGSAAKPQDLVPVSGTHCLLQTVLRAHADTCLDSCLWEVGHGEGGRVEEKERERDFCGG